MKRKFSKNSTRNYVEKSVDFMLYACLLTIETIGHSVLFTEVSKKVSAKRWELLISLRKCWPTDWFLSYFHEKSDPFSAKILLSQLLSAHCCSLSSSLTSCPLFLCVHSNLSTAPPPPPIVLLIGCAK